MSEIRGKEFAIDNIVDKLFDICDLFLSYYQKASLSKAFIAPVLQVL